MDGRPGDWLKQNCLISSIQRAGREPGYPRHPYRGRIYLGPSSTRPDRGFWRYDLRHLARLQWVSTPTAFRAAALLN